MNEEKSIVNFRPSRKVARRFVIYIVLLSSLITLLTTALQLYFDYRQDIAAIESHIEQIRSSHLKSITASVWVEDEQQINSQLDGLVRYVDMEEITITLEGVTRWQAGETRSTRVIQKQIPLVQFYRGKSVTIGVLNIVASIDSIVDRLIDKAVIILVSNGIKTFIVAGFIFLLFHYLVARHLQRLGEWARTFDLADKINPVELDRPLPESPDDADEFDAVAHALNEMQQKIQRSYGELKESHVSLEKRAIKSQEILNLHLEKMPLAAITWDRYFICVEWNKSAERIFGYTRDEAIGKYGPELIVTPEMRPNMHEIFDTLLNQTGGSHIIIENVTKNGETILCEWFNTPIKSDIGVPIAVASLAQDITLQQNYKNELVEAKEVAEQANMTKSAFLSSMSHELRTPLNAILGFGQLLEMEIDDEKQKKNARAIIQAGNHLLSLINDILDLSRVESDNLEWSVEDVRLNDVLEECLPLIQPLADDQQIQLIDQISGQSDYVLQVDYKRCKQILLNLLSNAVKYNKVHGSVTLSCEDRGDQILRINIIDTGPGIDDDKIYLLFEPFNRMGAERTDTEGTGIGLVITQRLVELMGGELGVESVSGEGSTFWIEFKVAAVSDAGSVIREEREPLQLDNGHAVPAEQAQILVAEDNKTNQEVLRQQLNLLGYGTDIADNGVEALEKWRSGDYQLLMTDIHMPEMDGYELVDNIRKTHQYAENKIPLIAITADAMQGQAKRCQDAGMDDYVSKPIHMEDLQTILKKWLSKNELDKSAADDLLVGQLHDDVVVAESRPSTEASIDRSMLSRMVGDDTARQQHLLQAFVQSTPDMLEEIHATISRNDSDALVMQAHKLKSSASSMGANELSDTCQALETAASNKQWEEVESLEPRLDELFQGVEHYLKENFPSD